MAKVNDRVEETTTTTGTGAVTLAGAVAGNQTFTAGFSDGDSVYYTIEAVDGNGVPTGDWEVGIGTFTASGTTLSRDTILASSNSGNAVSLSAGTKRVFSNLPALEVRRAFVNARDLQFGTL